MCSLLTYPKISEICQVRLAKRILFNNLIQCKLKFFCKLFKHNRFKNAFIAKFMEYYKIKIYIIH